MARSREPRGSVPTLGRRRFDFDCAAAEDRRRAQRA